MNKESKNYQPEQRLTNLRTIIRNLKHQPRKKYIDPSNSVDISTATKVQTKCQPSSLPLTVANERSLEKNKTKTSEGYFPRILCRPPTIYDSGTS